jgi:hypothetical protein
LTPALNKIQASTRHKPHNLNTKKGHKDKKHSNKKLREMRAEETTMRRREPKKEKEKEHRESANGGSASDANKGVEWETMQQPPTFRFQLSHTIPKTKKGKERVQCP